MTEDRERGLDPEDERKDRARPHVTESTDEILPDRPAGPGDNSAKSHREQTEDDREVARGIDEERGSHAHAGDENSGDRRTDQVRGSKQHRVQRDRVLHLSARDERGEQRLTAGRVKSGDRGVHETDEIDVPEGDLAGDDEAAEDQRRHDRGALRDQEEAPTLDAVRDGATDEREGKDRRAAEHATEAEKEGRVGELIEEPRRRRQLDPRARHRDELTDPVERVVAMDERREAREKSRHAFSVA